MVVNWVLKDVHLVPATLTAKANICMGAQACARSDLCILLNARDIGIIITAPLVYSKRDSDILETKAMQDI